jgi:hypothetical protein
LTVVIGSVAFVTGPKIWPMAHEVPMPPANLLPAYIVFAAVEALAFGFAIAFALLGWPAIRDLRLGAGWLNRLLFVTLIWFMGNWWFHDNLHMHIGVDMRRLVYVEYGFHGSMLACAVILVLSLARRANHAEVRRQPDRLTESPGATKSVTIDGRLVCEFPGVTPWTYARSVFRDESSDGKPDKNPLGI